MLGNPIALYPLDRDLSSGRQHYPPFEQMGPCGLSAIHSTNISGASINGANNLKFHHLFVLVHCC